MSKKKQNLTPEQTMERLRKELRINRFFSILTCLLLMAALAMGTFVCIKVNGYVEQIERFGESLEEVDHETLNETMEMFTYTMATLNETVKSVDWESVSAQIEAVDMEALNEAIAGLDTKELSQTLKNINTTLEKLDSEELQKALVNLNDAADALQKMIETLKGFVSKLGFGQ